MENIKKPSDRTCRHEKSESDDVRKIFDTIAEYSYDSHDNALSPKRIECDPNVSLSGDSGEAEHFVKKFLLHFQSEISERKNLADKAALINYFGYLFKESLEDELLTDAVDPVKALDILKEIVDNGETEMFTKIQAEITLSDSIGWYLYFKGLDLEDEKNDFLAKTGLKENYHPRESYRKYHDDSVKIDFLTNESVDAINGDRPDDHYFEANDLCRGVDYFTGTVSRGNIGIYTVSGRLVDWLPDERPAQASHNLKNNISDVYDWKSKGKDPRIFKIMNSLPFRQYMDEKLGVGLSGLSLREQSALLDYLGKAKSKDADGVLSFVADAGAPGGRRLNRLKAFLALEEGEDMGKNILGIGEMLKNIPDTADLLFAEFARIVDYAEWNSYKLEKKYNEIFYEKSIDRKSVYEAIMSKAIDLLRQASVDLTVAKSESKKTIMKNLILNLRREEKIKDRVIADFKMQLLELNKTLRQLEDLVLHEEFSKKKDEWIAQEQALTEFQYGSLPIQEIENRENEIMEEIRRKRKYDLKKLRALICMNNGTQNSASLIKKELDKRIFDNLHFKTESSIDEKDIMKDQEEKKDFVNKELSRLIGLYEMLQNGLDEFTLGKHEPAGMEVSRADVPEKVFKKYKEIIDLTKNLERRVKDAMLNTGKVVSEEEIDRIAERILKKASQLLASYSSKISRGAGADEQELIDGLEGYKTDLVLTASVWAGLGDIEFEDLRGAEFERLSLRELTLNGLAIKDKPGLIEYNDKDEPYIPGTSISGNFRAVLAKERAGELDQMRKMYGENYSAPGYEGLKKRLLHAFENRIKRGGEDSVCYIYKKDGKILAFIFYENKGEGLKHFNSLNAAPETQSTGIGIEILRRSLEQEQREGEIFGECDAAAPISAKYIGSDFGCIAEKAFPDYEGTGLLAFEIHLRDSNKSYESIKLSVEELESRWRRDYDGNEIEKTGVLIIKAPANSRELADKCAEILAEGDLVMTNYKFVDKGKNALCAFEKKIQTG